jgi:hypothetical protein
MADSRHTTDENPGKSAERLARDERLAKAFFNMDGDLHDLRHMASIAFDQVAEMVHDLYSGHIGDKRHLDRMLFTVAHLEDMIDDLYQKWDADFKEAPESNATGEGGVINQNSGETLDDLLAIPEHERTERDTQILGILLKWMQADQGTQNEMLEMLRARVAR